MGISGSQMLILVVLFASLSLFVQMRLDQVREKLNGPGVPEGQLLLLAIFGGAIGGTVAMWLYGLKKNKWYFRKLLPVLALFDAYLLFVFATMG